MTTPANLDKIPVLTNELSEPRKSPIDVQDATVGDVITLTGIDRQTHDSFKDIKGWQGVIVRVEDEPRNFEYSQRVELESYEKPDFKPKKYKVCILNGPGQIYSIPNTYNSPTDKRVINCLDDFSANPDTVGQLALGNVVWITQENYKDKKIEYSFSNTKIVSVAPNNPSTPPSPQTPQGQKIKPLPPGPPSPPPDKEVSMDPQDNNFPKPKIIIDKCNKDPKKYEEVINQFSVDVNPRYKKAGNTWCNIFAWDVACAMKVLNYPHWVSVKDQTLKGKTLKRNEPVNNGGFKEFYGQGNSTVVELSGYYTGTWFRDANNIKNFGWKIITNPKEAQEVANSGSFVVGTIVRSDGTGHVIIVRPDKDPYNETLGIMISQAGVRNVNGVRTTNELSNYIFATPIC